MAHGCSAGSTGTIEGDEQHDLNDLRTTCVIKMSVDKMISQTQNLHQRLLLAKLFEERDLVESEKTRG